MGNVRYEFSVEGTTFNGDRVSYGASGSGDTAYATGIVQRYAKGTSVTVYYMPGNPEECVLEPGLKAQSWIIVGVGPLFLTVGILMVVFVPNAIRKEESRKEKWRRGDPFSDEEVEKLTEVLRSIPQPGERVRVKVVKPGEGAGQGVGYLEDGTMVVVENARNMIGDEIELTVTRAATSSAGGPVIYGH